MDVGSNTLQTVLTRQIGDSYTYKDCGAALSLLTKKTYFLLKKKNLGIIDMLKKEKKIES